MDFYSFSNDILTKNLLTYGTSYDLFEPTMTDKKLKNLTLNEYIVRIDTEGRLDKISNELYGDTKYIEELMLINNIINPFSVKTGDIIYYISVDDMNALYLDKEDVKNKTDVLNINNPKSIRKDENRKNAVLPPIVKDSNNKQIIWDKDNKVVTINNKLN